MNTNELIEGLTDESVTGFNLTVAACEAAEALRSQQAEIEALNKTILKLIDLQCKQVCFERKEELQAELESLRKERELIRVELYAALAQLSAITKARQAWFVSTHGNANNMRFINAVAAIFNAVQAQTMKYLKPDDVDSGHCGENAPETFKSQPEQGDKTCATKQS